MRKHLDIAMTVLSIILMGGTVLFPDYRVHQILGMMLLALWLFHMVLNRRWYGSLFRGKYNSYRRMQIVVNIGITVCALLLMISGLMMAWFMPAEAFGGGIEFARTSHLVSSHWYLLFMCFHIGMHISMMTNRIPARYLGFARFAALIASCYGIYAFIIRGLWRYMLLIQQFFFLDLDRGYILFAVDYLSILILFSTISHYLSRLLLVRNR